MNKQEILIYYDNKEILAKTVVSSCVVCSEHRIDIINSRSIKERHLNVFITERFIEKIVSFWD